ncbi:hypothetical protein [Egbenema bharatensis]|uniref:hypothetical protein n=1 Tax=Egbenema bharatensis TaxID=3463334 RepID=UPI003A8BDD7E
MAQVVLENVYKSFPHQRGDRVVQALPTAADRTAQGVSVLRRIDLTVQDGEFMVLVGPPAAAKVPYCG